MNTLYTILNLMAALGLPAPFISEFDAQGYLDDAASLCQRRRYEAIIALRDTDAPVVVCSGADGRYALIVVTGGVR